MTPTRSPSPQPVQGAILAGGRSTRYGGLPKGLEQVGGRRILDRLVEAFEEALGHPPVLVANDPDAGGWRAGLRVVPDRRPGCGTLGGIYTALVDAPAPVVCVAWDMPFVPAGLIRVLADGLDGWDTFLPASEGRRGVEPTCAAYGPACRDPVAASLDRGDFRAIAFHDAVKVGILPPGEVERFAAPERLFFNVNSPEDLIRANDLWRRHESSR